MMFVLCVIATLLLRSLDSSGDLLAFQQSFGSFAPLFTVPIHIIIAITPFPSDAVSIGNGAIYGFAMGTALSWFGWWLAALLEFALGRRAREDFVLEASLARAPAWIKRFPIAHPGYLIGSRQIPWLGGHISTFVPGAMGVSWRRYVWCSAIAVIPGAVVMSGIGAGLLRLR
jgi:uncharacterized membrane protein YdjX (TVP38/TMEM64 family)